MTSENKKKARAAQKSAPQRAQTERQLAVEVGASPEKPRWREHASFRVGFYSLGVENDDTHWQTRAYRDETEAEATWPEIAGQQLIEWLCAQGDVPQPAQTKPEPESAAEPAPKPEPAGVASATPEPPAGADADLRIVVGDLELDELTTNQHGGTSAKLMRARLGFHLSGLYAGPAAASQARYGAQFTAYNLDSGAALALGGASAQLDPALLDYTAEATFEIPDIGVYQIVGMVVLAADRAAAIGVGPRLTVVS
jgi:hypothetical protein